MTAWIVFVVGGVITYLMRASFMSIGSNVPLPSAVRRGLKYVAPAVLAAIVVPAVLGDDGFASFAAPDARLVAALIAAVVALKVRNVPLVLAVGMVSFWLLQWAGVG